MARHRAQYRAPTLGERGLDLLSQRSLNVIAVILMPITLPCYVIRHPREAWHVFTQQGLR